MSFLLKKSFRIFIILSLVFIVLSPMAIQASTVFDEARSEFGSLEQGAGVQTGLTDTAGTPRVIAIIVNIIKVALGFVGIIFTAMFIYAGYLWMTAAGNDDQVNKAKKFMRNSVIGVVIVMMSYAIVAFAIPAVQKATTEAAPARQERGFFNF